MPDCGQKLLNQFLKDQSDEICVQCSYISDTLPHRSNLNSGKVRDNQCPLCKEKQTLSNILNSYSKALNLHRYTDD